MKTPLLLSRREVVRRLVLGTAACWVAGLWQTNRVLAVLSAARSSAGTLRLRVSQFPALAEAGGSVRLNAGLSHPVAINRGPNDAFYAVSTRCQHLGCVVNAYSAALDRMVCFCHGSRYRIDGSLAGGPALLGLDAYPIRFSAPDDLAIDLPGVTFAAQDVSIESVASGTQRLRLAFQPVIFSTYQLEYRAELTDAPVLVPFSLTPNGTADQTSYRHENPKDLNPTISLYLDATGAKGFVHVALVVSEY